MTPYEEALLFAIKHHQGQTRWSGDPYILHPLRVASRFHDPMNRVIAILHDTVEDSAATLDEIRELFGDEVVSAVDALTRRKSEESYKEFILRARSHPRARLVKIWDIRDNLEEVPDEGELLVRYDSLRGRYEKALETLLGEADV